MVPGQEIRDRDVMKLQKLLFFLYKNCCSFRAGRSGVDSTPGVVFFLGMIFIECQSLILLYLLQFEMLWGIRKQPQHIARIG